MLLVVTVVAVDEGGIVVVDGIDIGGTERDELVFEMPDVDAQILDANPVRPFWT